MNHTNYKNTSAYIMPDREFRRLSSFIYDELGIKMPLAKKAMLQARLQKRLQCLELTSFKDYCDYLFSPEGMEAELLHLIDAVTTNKTDFFREIAHFEYLLNTALPALIRQRGAGVSDKLMVWSAGCSSGEEPYTLAMVISEFAKVLPGYKFLVLATDVSRAMLSVAERGVYSEDRIEPIPMELRKKYLLKSKDRAKKLVKFTPDIISRVIFRRLNFMEGDFGFREPLDIIFCRNVFIYFDKQTQEWLTRRFAQHLIAGGYFFIGHTEILNKIDMPLTQVAPAIYRKNG